MTLTFGSLFSGIGGLDLGLDRSGMQCRWQVEIDAFARQVLARHWPDVRRHDDVRTWPQSDTESVDLIAGGFPCTEISDAGKREGISGEHSGLWKEFSRIIRVLRPRFVLIENVSALLTRGLDVVLCDLAEGGYDAEWHCLSAAGFGAYHIRDRVFILAYPNGDRLTPIITSDRILDARSQQETSEWCGRKPELKRGLSGRVWAVPDADILGVADGFRKGLDEDRLRVLGNSVVPKIAFWIGRRIVEALEQ
jgi:DNA (cytosine-5)-methyltransferase 1